MLFCMIENLQYVHFLLSTELVKYAIVCSRYPNHVDSWHCRICNTVEISLHWIPRLQQLQVHMSFQFERDECVRGIKSTQYSTLLKESERGMNPHYS